MSEALRKKPTTGIAGCCARAPIGHAAAVPPSNVMNSRRFMNFLPEPKTKPTMGYTAPSGKHCASQQKRPTHVSCGSPPEVALFGLMSAPTSSGHTGSQGYVVEVPILLQKSFCTGDQKFSGL